MSLTIGERKILNRPTFLHEGIIVMKGISVKIVALEGDNVIVEFIDREGYPHKILDIKREELS